jgi:hypothetical protein
MVKQKQLCTSWSTSCSWPSAGSADAGPDAGTKRVPVRPHILANCHLARLIQRFRLHTQETSKNSRTVDLRPPLLSLWEQDGRNRNNYRRGECSTLPSLLCPSPRGRRENQCDASTKPHVACSSSDSAAVEWLLIRQFPSPAPPESFPGPSASEFLATRMRESQQGNFLFFGCNSLGLPGTQTSTRTNVRVFFFPLVRSDTDERAKEPPQFISHPAAVDGPNHFTPCSCRRA